MCNFMLINFREDLQINLARDITLPKGPQTSQRSIVTMGYFYKVDQMSGATTVFLISMCRDRGQGLYRDFSGFKRIVQMQGRDYI
jgi:hypothetical protein